MAEISAGVQRVQEILAAAGIESRVVELPDSTRTAKEAAAAIGCELGQIVKSLIFKGKDSGLSILAVASGVNRVDETALAALAGEPIEKADADFVREKTGYAIGGVPPIGLKEPPLTFIDEDLLQFTEIWAAGGTPHAVFRLTPQELLALTKGKVAGIK